MNENVMTKCIINPTIARRLIKAGGKVVDIKPNRNRKGGTVFVFEVNDVLHAELTAVSAEKTAKREVDRLAAENVITDIDQ